MYKHPSAARSLLRCKTLFTSKDEEGTDMRKEQWFGQQQFVIYMKRWEECLGISRDVLMRSARRLRPVELQLQAVSDILYQQRQRYCNNKEVDRPFPTKPPFRDSLGLKFASDLEGLLDDFERENDEPNGLSTSPMSLLHGKFGPSDRLSKLESDAFQLLSRHWHDYNYLVQKNEHMDSGDTIAVHNMGKDVGSEAVPYLIDQEYKDSTPWKWNMPKEVERKNGVGNIRPNRMFSLSTIDKINGELKKYGLTVVRNVFDKEDIQEIRQVLHLKSSLARDTAFKILEIDPNVSALKYTRGRIHCILRGTSFDRLLAPLQRFWIPIVYYTLERPLYISNIQLVLSDAMSYVEPWHRNNRNFGINVVVALQDIDEEKGRIQFLPGTHDASSEINPYKTGKVAVDLKMGDILIFDSRILHRHTINESNRCQSCLVYTYDCTSTPPPGQGPIKFVLDKWRGVMTDMLSRA